MYSDVFSIKTVSHETGHEVLMSVYYCHDCGSIIPDGRTDAHTDFHRGLNARRKTEVL